MHYTDKEQLSRNILELGIYIHGVCGTEDIDIEINSIQNCQYFSPRILRKMLKNPTRYFKKINEIHSLDQEKWFLVKIKQVGWDDISIEHVECVDNFEDDILRLH